MKKIKNLVYPAKITFNKEDNVYFVKFPDFDYCITDGETLEIAKEMAKEALSLCLDGMIDDKEEFPKPSILTSEEIFYIEGEIGTSSYTEYHKKSYEKNKDSILTTKKQKEAELLKNGYTNFKTFLPKESVRKLNLIIKKKKLTRQDFLENLIEEEFKKLPV